VHLSTKFCPLGEHIKSSLSLSNFTPTNYKLNVIDVLINSICLKMKTTGVVRKLLVSSSEAVSKCFMFLFLSTFAAQLIVFDYDSMSINPLEQLS